MNNFLDAIDANGTSQHVDTLQVKRNCGIIQICLSDEGYLACKWLHLGYETNGNVSWVVSGTTAFALMLQINSVFCFQALVHCQDATLELWVTPAFTGHSCFSPFILVDVPWKADVYSFCCIETETCPHFFSSGRQIESQPAERIMMITSPFKIKSPWQRWWFWERKPSWLSQVPALCPDAHFRQTPQDQELQRETIKNRYDWDRACGWGWILPEIGCHLFHEAKLMDRQFLLFLDWHSCTKTGNQVGRGLKYFEQVFPFIP